MDRIQFCTMLKDARKLSGVSWVDVCYKMNRTQATILDMLSGKRDPSMEKIFNFIEAIEAEVIVGRNMFLHEPELHKWLTNKCAEFPEKVFCELIHTTTRTVGRIRANKSHYKVSYFLDILDYFKLTCEVVPVDLAQVHQTDDCNDMG